MSNGEEYWRGWEAGIRGIWDGNASELYKQGFNDWEHIKWKNYLNMTKENEEEQERIEKYGPNPYRR